MGKNKKIKNLVEALSAVLISKDHYVKLVKADIILDVLNEFSQQGRLDGKDITYFENSMFENEKVQEWFDALTEDVEKKILSENTFVQNKKLYIDNEFICEWGD